MKAPLTFLMSISSIGRGRDCLHVETCTLLTTGILAWKTWDVPALFSSSEHFLANSFFKRSVSRKREVSNCSLFATSLFFSSSWLCRLARSPLLLFFSLSFMCWISLSFSPRMPLYFSFSVSRASIFCVKCKQIFE